MIALKGANIVNPVIHLADGEKALEYVFATGSFSDRNNESNPVLILLDLKMPKVDGIEVLQKIKSDMRTRGIPVIIFTSSPVDSDIKRCYDLGANSYVVKPVEFSDLEEVIKDIGNYWILTNRSPQSN